jgi:signal transduction histidine kinase
MRDDQVTRSQMPHHLSAPTMEPCPASILIVDDEEALWTSLVTAFTLEGYRAAGVGSAREALQHLRQVPCDVLLVDLRMPDMDGIQLMERVRECAPDTLVILMTGVATVESAVRALKGGAYDYILKPFTLAEIFHTVKRGLDQQRLKQENVQLNDLNRRLQELDQIKSNLLSAITHEFRTPLTVMSGWMDLLLGDHFGPLAGKQRESLAAIRTGIIRLGRLISNLLVFVETDRSQQSGTRIPLSLASVLQGLAAEVAPDCHERRVRLSVETAPDLPPLLGDGERLRLLFFNLVENAIKFNEPAGQVAIHAGKDGDSILISVTNTRGEIPVERIPRLLEPFTQGDMSASRAAGGLGVGLAVARLIAEAHDGQLVVESGQGKGTTVRVNLPLRN